MESSLKVLDFVGILKESIKVLFRNGKLMPSITIITLLLYSFLYLSAFFSIKSSITNIFFNRNYQLVTTPNSLEFIEILVDVKEDFGVHTILQSTFYFAHIILSFFLVISTIFATSIIYNREEKNLSLHEWVCTISKSWKRSLLTLFYITLLSVGYINLALNIMPAKKMFLNHHPSILQDIGAALIILAMILLYLYLAIVWSLSIVISVLDSTCYGIEALGKAAQLVKGQGKKDGFIINLNLGSLSMLGIIGGELSVTKESQGVISKVIIGLLVVISVTLLRIFMIISYTIYYFEYKKRNGEEQKNEDVECSRIFEYTKIPDEPLVNKDVLP